MAQWLKAMGAIAAAALFATGCMDRARTEDGTGGSGSATDTENVGDDTPTTDEGINAGPDDGLGGAGQDPDSWDQGPLPEGAGGSGDVEEGADVEELPPEELPPEESGTGGAGTIDEEGAIEPAPDDTLDDPMTDPMDESDELPPMPEDESGM